MKTAPPIRSPTGLGMIWDSACPPKRVYSRDEAIDTHADVAFVQDRLGHTNVQNAIIYMRYTTVTRDAQTRQLFASHRVVLIDL